MVSQTALFRHPQENDKIFTDYFNFTKENIKNVDKNEYYCIYPAFADFTILRKKEDISKYREIYEEKTGKTWKTATLQEIFKSEMVW